MVEIKHKEKIIGRFEGNTYFTSRKPEHFMRIYQGFGISDKVLKALYVLGCKKVSIRYGGVKGVIIYECSLNQFIESTKTFTFEDDDFQKFVSIKDMKEI